MKFLKISAYVLLIGCAGYCKAQLMKKRPTKESMQKHLESLTHHNSEHTAIGKASPGKSIGILSDDTTKPIDRINGQIWLKENLLPIAADLSHLRSFTDEQNSDDPQYIFAANNSIPIRTARTKEIIDALKTSETNPALYNNILKKIDNFITLLKNELDKPENKPYKDYFKKFDQSTQLTTDESAIIDKLKGANTFCIDFATAITNASLNESNPTASTVLMKNLKTQESVQKFAQNYFNLTLS